MNYPYDDSNMRYDYGLHRYVLTKEGVFEILGINLDTQFNQFEPNARQRRVERFLKKVTNTVYDYIYEGSWNSQYLEYVLAKCPELREYIQEMLSEQVEYALENNFIQDFSGVNISKNSAIKKNDLRGSMRVAKRVEDICTQDITDLGIVLKTINPLPSVPRSAYRRDY